MPNNLRFALIVIFQRGQKVPYYRNTPRLPKQPLSLRPAHVADIGVMRGQAKQPESKMEQLLAKLRDGIHEKDKFVPYFSLWQFFMIDGMFIKEKLRFAND